MKLLKLYSWICGTMNDFTKPFADNKALYSQARAFWNKLDNISLVFVLICVVLGIAIAYFYYTQYNNKPGRHYTPKHWLIWLAVTAVATFLLTLGFECLAVAPKITGSFVLELKIAFGNAIYASIVYFLTSVVWCNCFPTNAYRLFKI